MDAIDCLAAGQSGLPDCFECFTVLLNDKFDSLKFLTGHFLPHDSLDCLTVTSEKPDYRDASTSDTSS